ncbi:indole-3-glycerol phosphate synthase TrpC [Spirulina sp. CS-785/01]|uniref:indole-3-glycerol phosphate synthase TrpC n=1 Tax=Spirulina sp. CS-785/01 TaxID=3021716 RepID=UPI00232D4116|nr:indole-3-glycerol phosphate synthase TrpC [Spirulina sp. CS-785/01]MDB9313792.1 indole-3-glycerol phosphate synthase TrpC [Spirulina sp. CS-785/01]
MQIRRINPSPAVKISHLQYKAAVPDAEPRNILERIVWHKEAEVDGMRDRLPLLQLKGQVQGAPPPKDFLGALKNGKTNPALIAEVKKASPSKGVIREDFDPVTIAQTYEKAGASCISVLTDSKFFQGSYENLAKVRQTVALPLLCKEFIIYPYQIYQARSQGADAILLIAAILSDQDLRYFIKIIRTLGMTPLIEVHSQEELERVLQQDEVQLIGINNRNLEDFSVSLETTQTLLKNYQQTLQNRQICVVSESGLHTAQDVDFVKNWGAEAVLIGESLLRNPDPEAAITALFP